MSGLQQARRVTPLQHTIAQLRNPVHGLIGVAALVSTMRVVEADVGTACTDTVAYIYVDPAFMAGLNLSQRLFVLVHEGYHKWGRFFERFEVWAKLHPTVPRMELLQTFNKAHDYLINHTIHADLGLEMPAGVLFSTTVNNKSHTIERLANEMMAGHQPQNMNPAPGGGPPQPGQGKPEPGKPGQGDGMMDGTDVSLPDMYNGKIETVPSAGQLKEHIAHVRKDMANAARAGKAAGDKSGFSEMMADESKKDKVNWSQVLARWAAKVRNAGALTFARPNKRYRVPGGRVQLPSRRSVKLGAIAIVMDTSGSMMGELMSQVMAEVKATLRGVDFDTLYVLHVDRQVQKVLEFKKQDLPKWTPQIFGGGGTAFLPAFSHMHREMPKLAAIVYHTDGHSSMRDLTHCEDVWEQMGRPPVLWAINDLSPEIFKGRCKFGTVMDCR